MRLFIYPKHLKAARCYSRTSKSNILNVGKLNMFQAVNDALDLTMKTIPHSVIIGEDVAFGGVFRCTNGLQHKYGSKRVFNSPLSEQGIIGFACGFSSMGGVAIAEIQFSDYIFPAFDQIANEIAKYRYRSGGQFSCGSLVIRAPSGAVGHGGLYHSQSPESFFTHLPGLVVLVPSGPKDAKGLLLSAVENENPCIILEPKVLYRSQAEEVPQDYYKTPIGQAQLATVGTDVTVVSWGALVNVLKDVALHAQRTHNISCEVVDLRTLLPWDFNLVSDSVRKTGRLVIVHEAPRTGGFGAEIAAAVQENTSFYLKAPILRICGWDTPFPLAFEKFYLPNFTRCLDGIRRVYSL